MRRAYGAHRAISQATLAEYIAESIQRRIAEGWAWTWAEYGVSDRLRQQVQELLERQQAACRRRTA